MKTPREEDVEIAYTLLIKALYSPKHKEIVKFILEDLWSAGYTRGVNAVINDD